MLNYCKYPLRSTLYSTPHVLNLKILCVLNNELQSGNIKERIKI